MTRIGIVGVGGMGTFHARTLAGLAGVEVVVVADPDGDRTEPLAREIGCESSPDPLATAARDDLDGVVIASPDETHPELAIAALQAGSYVLCEKPLGATLADARHVVDAEVALGERRIQLGFMREYDAAHVQLAEAIGTIGAIDHVRLVHRNANRQRRPIEQIVVQSLVHEAHSVRFLTGHEVTEVTAFGAGPDGTGSFRHVLVHARLSNGGHAALEFDDGGFAYEVSVEVLGRDADAVTGQPLRAVTRRDGSVDVHLGADWFGWFADAYRVQDDAWVASIRHRQATGPTTWDGYAAQAIVEAAMMSLETGRSIPVDVEARPDLYA